MITGWLSGEDCPDCGGPLLETSTGSRFLTLACSGCGYSVTWHAADPGPCPGPDSADPEDQEN